MIVHVAHGARFAHITLQPETAVIGTQETLQCNMTQNLVAAHPSIKTYSNWSADANDRQLEGGRKQWRWLFSSPRWQFAGQAPSSHCGQTAAASHNSITSVSQQSFCVSSKRSLGAPLRCQRTCGTARCTSISRSAFSLNNPPLTSNHRCCKLTQRRRAAISSAGTILPDAS